MAVSFPVGSYHDGDLLGMAHLVEHGLHIGNALFPDHHECTHYVQSHSGVLNATTEDTQTRYFFQIHPDHLEEALKRFLGMFWSPTFDKDKILKEVAVVDDEYCSKKEKLHCKLTALLRVLFNPERPEKYAFMGSRQSLQHEAIERHARQFWESYYSSHQMTLVIYSSQSLDELARLAQIFDLVPRREVVSPPLLEVPLLDPKLKSMALKWYGQPYNLVAFVWERDDIPRRHLDALIALLPEYTKIISESTRHPITFYAIRGLDNRSVIVMYMMGHMLTSHQQIVQIMSMLLKLLPQIALLSEVTIPPDYSCFAQNVASSLNFADPVTSLASALDGVKSTGDSKKNVSLLLGKLKLEDAQIVVTTSEKPPKDGSALLEPLFQSAYVLIPKDEIMSAQSIESNNNTTGSIMSNVVHISLTLLWPTGTRIKILCALLSRKCAEIGVSFRCSDQSLELTLSTAKGQSLLPILTQVAHILGGQGAFDESSLNLALKEAFLQNRWIYNQSIINDIVLEYARLLCGDQTDYSYSLEDPDPERLSLQQVYSFQKYLWINGKPTFYVQLKEPLPGETLRQLKSSFYAQLNLSVKLSDEDHTIPALVPRNTIWLYAPPALRIPHAAAAVVIQLHDLDSTERFWADLFTYFAKLLFFQELRGAEQFGYTIQAAKITSKNTGLESLAFYVQARVKPEEILARIDKFLDEINDTISFLSEDNFGAYIEGFLTLNSSLAGYTVLRQYDRSTIIYHLSSFYYHMISGSQVKSGFLKILFWPKHLKKEQEQVLLRYEKMKIKVIRTIDDYPRIPKPSF